MLKKLFNIMLVFALILMLAIPAFAIKILPYGVPLQDLMQWDKADATLKLSNPEGENMSVSWPTTVDFWNYNGSSWTYDLPTGNNFAFSKLVEVNISSTATAGTVRGLALTQTVGAAGAIHEGIKSHVTSAYATGSWTNAVVGVLSFTGGTGSASGGMAAPICSELNMQAAKSSGGSYYSVHSYISVPTAAELIDSTSFNYAWEKYEVSDNASSDFGLYGLLWHIVGLESVTTKVFYNNTLKIQIDTTKWYIPLSSAEGSYTTSYPIVTSSSVTFSGAATGLDHPIDMNSITAMTGDETVDCGSIIKINRTAGAVGGTHAGLIVKNYITGTTAVDGTGVISAIYSNLKYTPTSENVAAEVSLLMTNLYTGSDTIDYGWYTIAPAAGIDSLIGVSGDMTNFLEVKATGDAGMTVSADGMFKDPHTDNEAGYLTIRIEGGEIYEIPFYDAD